MDILNYLNQFERVTKEPTLEAMEYIMQKLSNPEKHLNFIHVAGTNGKGSICEMLSSVLVKQGYKVGKYITPYLVGFNEEISVNNTPISDNEINEIIKEIDPIIKQYNSENKTPVKWFEVTTSMAIKYFSDKKCDIVIFETGLGGLNDCTNIVDSLISVIANIGYDHMDLLGNTLEEIAEHKAGIIKQNKGTVFVNQEEVISVIEKVCKEKNNKLHLIQKEEVTNYAYNKDFQVFDYKKYKQVSINLKGKEQIYNAAVCMECFEILREKGYKIEELNIREGLKNVIHKARFELLNKNPIVIFDGGHNENAIINLQRTLKQYYENKRVIYIISILKTKDYKTILNHILEDKNAVLFLTDGTDEDKYVSKEELYKTVLERTPNSEAFYQNSLETSIKTAMQNYPDDIICITGSFYVYSNVRKYFDNIDIKVN